MDAILVLDFGGQYAHLIARRVRSFKVYSEIVPPDLTEEELKAYQERLTVKGLILSGGPASVYDEAAPRCGSYIFSLGLPLLGICYGHQLMAHVLGGEVTKLDKAEYGVAEAYIDKPVGPLRGLGPVEKVWMSHRDSVVKLPQGFEVLAHTENCAVAAMGDESRKIYGLQWHPEVVHTARGDEMLRNFVFDVCGCRPEWTVEDFIEKAVEEIRSAVGSSKAVLALSGGVDSSTTAALAARALGDRFTAVFVDHGFMREGEPEFIVDTFAKLGVKLIAVDAGDRFFKALRGVVDPEEKRRIIGELFIKVFEEEAKKLGAEYLIQGTIYPDRIESGFRRHSEKIKTHHNVAGLPSKMEFKGIVEPLRDLYKDEVREVAKQLGLPEEIVYRQPFPGPGLAVRVIGEVTPMKVEVVRKADRIVREEVERAGLNRELWQYFAVLTDTNSTGVRGDARAYGLTVAIRAVESREAMTASFAKLPYDLLERISTRITNEVPEVTRVVYDVTNKPPATIEWE